MGNNNNKNNDSANNKKNLQKISFLDEELDIEYNSFLINFKISSDYNYIKINANSKLYPKEIYEYLMIKDEFNNNFNNNKNGKKEVKDFFDIIEQLFKEKKVIINYDKKLYNIKFIIKLNTEQVILNFDKKFTDVQSLDFKSELSNIKFQENLISSNYVSGCNSLFEVYISYLDSKAYLICSLDRCELSIILLEDNSLVTKLKGHGNFITSIRYFFNEVTKEEYIISSSEYHLVIVWNIQNNFSIEFKENINYSLFCQIYSCIITNIQQFNYIIISSYVEHKDTNKKKAQSKDCTKMYSLMNKDFIKDIYNTESNNTRYMLSWYNENDEENYIIELCDKKISINNLLKNKNYCTLKSIYGNEEFLSGFIYSKDDNNYLITGSWNGFVRIWNLDEKIEVNFLNTKSLQLYSILLWNEKCALITNISTNEIKIMDLEYCEIVTILKSNHFIGIECIKKIIHPLYGESLLTCHENGQINLFILSEQ